MLKITIITLFVVGLLVYIGSYGYNKFIAISFARNIGNYYDGTDKASKTSIMTLSDCTPGYIPLLRSYQGKIVVEPTQIEVLANAKVQVINTDTAPHTIGIAYTQVWEAINPGDSFVIDTAQLPQADKWFVTCDAINLGENSPTIRVSQSF